MFQILKIPELVFHGKYLKNDQNFQGRNYVPTQLKTEK